MREHCGDSGKSGRQRGALNAGEARILMGMVAGVSPEPVESFILISVLKCPDCQEGHMLALDKDISIDECLMLLNSAVGLMVMARLREEVTGDDDIYGAD